LAPKNIPLQSLAAIPNPMQLPFAFTDASQFTLIFPSGGGYHFFSCGLGNFLLFIFQFSIQLQTVSVFLQRPYSPIKNYIWMPEFTLKNMCFCEAKSGGPKPP
jgi:hypothetical protein